MKIIHNNTYFYSYQHLMRYIFRAVFFSLCLLATACAHRINITPEISELEAVKLPRIEKNVGYYISPENLNKSVVTPAGGGDKVKYLPYKESEPVLKTILANIFFNVYQVPSLDDPQFISSRNISYVFIPEIETNSSSRSMWIWPPSDFTVKLECKAVDPSKDILWQTTVKSEAHMGLPQVHRNYGLAGKVAISKAFSKLQHKIHSQFYEGTAEEYYAPRNAVDSFDEGKDEYYSPLHQKSKEQKGATDSFDGADEYYSPGE